MQLKVKSKNLELTDALKDYAQKKFSRIDRYFDQVLSADVMLCTEKNTHIAGATIHVNGNILRGEERSGNMYSSIDMLLDKLERQVHKIKEKRKNHHQKHESLLPIPESEESLTVLNRTVHPFHPGDAAKELDRLKAPFYLFINRETGELNVVYRNDENQLILLIPIK